MLQKAGATFPPFTPKNQLPLKYMRNAGQETAAI